MKLKSLRKFETRMGKSFCQCSDSPPPPDYSELAAASEESARIAAEMGREQLDFAKLQYQDARPVYQDIVDQQMSIADKTAAQGDDYYEYLKTYRPAERAIFDEAMIDDSAKIAAARTLDEADAKIVGGQDSDVYGLRRSEIDAEVGRAVADTQGGYTRAINQAMRQGLRYGASNAGIANDAGALGLAQASNIASAANASRAQGIMGQRGLAATNTALRRDITSNENQSKAINWAKKLDAAGLVKGLPGASTGAYGLAVSAGNSAGNNQSAPGAQLQGAMGQSAGTTLQGRQLYQSGLGNIMDTQAGLYGDSMAASSSTTGAAIGAVAGIGIAI